MSLPFISQDYASASATVHTITHSARTLNPDVTVIDQATGLYVIPTSIEVLSLTQVRISLFSALAIRGTIR